MNGTPIQTDLQGVRTLGVVSDTHGHVLNTQEAVRALSRFGIDAVLHCGDIGSPEIPALFQSWPAHYVQGNVDWPGQQLLAAIEAAGGVFHGRFGALAAAGRRVAFLHGDDVDRFDAEIESGQWDLICHGHTHRTQRYVQGKTLIVNPGALQRAWPPSIAVVELEDLQVTSIPLDL